MTTPNPDFTEPGYNRQLKLVTQNTLGLARATRGLVPSFIVGAAAASLFSGALSMGSFGARALTTEMAGINEGLYQMQSRLALAASRLLRLVSPAISAIIDKIIEWDDALDGWLSKSALILGALGAFVVTAGFVIGSIIRIVGWTRRALPFLGRFGRLLGALKFISGPTLVIAGLIEFNQEITKAIENLLGLEEDLDRFINRNFFGIDRPNLLTPEQRDETKNFLERERDRIFRFFGNTLKYEIPGLDRLFGIQPQAQATPQAQRLPGVAPRVGPGSPISAPQRAIERPLEDASRYQYGGNTTNNIYVLGSVLDGAEAVVSAFEDAQSRGRFRRGTI